MHPSEDAKQDVRQNIEKIITANTYRAYEMGCVKLGTTDLVVIVDGNMPENSPRDVVIARETLAGDPKVPTEVRERIATPPNSTVSETGVFWVIAFWKQSVAAIKVSSQILSKGGDA